MVRPWEAGPKVTLQQPQCVATLFGGAGTRCDAALRLLAGPVAGPGAAPRTSGARLPSCRAMGGIGLQAATGKGRVPLSAYECPYGVLGRVLFPALPIHFGPEHGARTPSTLPNPDGVTTDGADPGNTDASSPYLTVLRLSEAHAPISIVSGSPPAGGHHQLPRTGDSMPCASLGSEPLAGRSETGGGGGGS